MIVICDFRRNGVDGRKVRELCKYLRQHIERRSVADIKAYKQMCCSIRRRVKELNTVYNKSVEIIFEEQFSELYGNGLFRFFRPGSHVAFISMEVFLINEYEEGGTE